MRHFTASTAIRQDGPLALSPLTGVVSVFSGYSCFRTIENLHIGPSWPTGTANKTRLCLTRNDDGEKQVGALFSLFTQVHFALITVLPSLAASRAMSVYC